jgi:hypothetical protein
MQDFIKNFQRDPDGSWRCIAACEIRHVLGRIQVAHGTRFMPGTIFMAVDIVDLLERERERQGPSPRPTVG